MTPGPWRWVVWPNEAYLVGPGFKAVRGECAWDDPAVVLDADVSNGEYRQAIDPEGPDAKLMGAAPDLLAACKNIDEIYDYHPELGNRAMWQMAMVELRAAIGKAEGK